MCQLACSHRLGAGRRTGLRQVWKALLAHRFPRLKVGPPNRLTNRQLYRVQLDVKALRQMPISAPPATPPPAKLRDFTFTIELTLMSHGEDEDGKPRAPRDRMHIGSTDTWVGKLREATSPSISFARFDGAHEIGCQLDLAPFAFDDDRRARCCVYLTTPSLQTVSSFTTALAKRPVTTFVTAMMRPSLTWLCRVRMLGLTLSGHLRCERHASTPCSWYLRIRVAGVASRAKSSRAICAEKRASSSAPPLGLGPATCTCCTYAALTLAQAGATRQSSDVSVTHPNVTCVLCVKTKRLQR